jgi:tetratricopeptide (TPR) repeat protein
LLLAVGLIFGQTGRYEFVNFDDGGYVAENPYISGGLTVRGITWVFTHSHEGNWHPLTGLTHMLDCQLYGLNPGAHHLTNVLLHAATAVLLFLVLWQMTNGFWPSALVAALFAVHPLRVESVAWASERKDVLSALFFVLTLGAYVRYARSPFSRKRYLLVVAAYALGLMAKPMLVTLPCVLLLLDYWPLGRMISPTTEPPARGGRSSRFSFPRRLVLEKLPLLLLTVVFCGVTLWAQGEAVTPTDRLPFGWRLANALVSCVAYLGQFFWPAGLAVYYPHLRSHLPIWQAAAALVLLGGISAGALACWRRYPYLLIGWLWYLGMLVPVIGLVQVGAQGMADRYTHLTQIGLCIAVVFGLADLTRSWSYRGWVRGVSSALVLAVLMGCAWRQTSFWQDSETLWSHALACTSQNHVAHNELGLVLAGRGRFDQAIAHYQKALEISPDYAETHNNLGVALAGSGQVDSAMAHYQKALEIEPNSAEIHNNLGNALAGRGQLDLAIAHYQKALEIKPDYADAHYNLGNALAGRGQVDSAIAHYQKALEIKPDYAQAHNNLGNALTGRGQVDSAIAHYQKALEIKPGYAQAHYNFGRALSEKGRFDEATAHFQRAVQLKPDDAQAHYNLAVALAGRGQIDSAIAHYQKALEIKPDYADAHSNLGNVLLGLGQWDEALGHLRKVVELSPEGAVPHNTLGAVLAASGRFDEAVAQFQKALQIQPDYAEAQKNLALLRATCPQAPLRNGAEAIEHARRADQLCGSRRADVLDVLAAAYAEAGRFTEALATARKALELTRQQNNRALADTLRARIALYEAGKPFHQPLPASAPAR